MIFLFILIVLNSKLLFVNEIYRHGARYPGVNPPYNNDKNFE